MTNNFSTYQSVFSWRYGSVAMRRIFSEEHKYELWRRIWVALAEAEFEQGLVNKHEVDDLKKQQGNIDIARILELENETKHDVVAAIKEFAEKATIGGGKIHLGATSMDVVDNADAMRHVEALEHVEQKVLTVLGLFSGKIDQYAELVCMAFTHLQPAEPTTVGYRLSFYAQDLLLDLELLRFIKQNYKGKGMKGAVGTAAGYKALLGDDQSVDQLEQRVMDKLGIDAALISTQVYSRKYDFLLQSLLASISSSLAKFAGDLRLLQSPPIGEWAEPFGKTQVGSSAMPFKRNPINAEKICSLARYVASLPAVGLENASLSYLERTLDDSANRRITLPDAFLATDEILITAEKLIKGLVINEKRISHNLSLYAPFAASEGILMACVKKGADRQKLHEVLREIALVAWEKVQNGEENPMNELLRTNATLQRYLSEQEIIAQLDVSNHIGTAPERARKMVKEIGKKIK
ncbi:adenylosuccinate lyase [soil metagenome]